VSFPVGTAPAEPDWLIEHPRSNIHFIASRALPPSQEEQSMTTADIRIRQLEPTRSEATRGGPETAAAAGEASVSKRETNLRPLRHVVPVERSLARHGWIAALSSVGHRGR
jgi:hypothetical protein